ncbi:MAG: toll/interleukin-1 receptor domain-containing protein [Solobacterium sp.]|nr:toll/interleukin-1 receptor domain-containing protein [Solobacterium sp.]
MTEHGNNMIFISHSSKDLKKVRMIRNYLEENDYDPILLHLGCMDSDAYATMSDGELLDTALFRLIRQEIEARHLFLYCDSAAAQQSRFVQLERTLVDEQKEKAVLRIDMGLDNDVICARINRFLTCNTIFLHYCSEDRAFAEGLRNALNQHDDIYLWDPRNHNVLNSSDRSAYVIEKGLMATKEIGCWYLPVLSADILKKYGTVIEQRLQEKNLRIVPLLKMPAEEALTALPSFKAYRNYSIDCRDEISAEELTAAILERIRKHDKYTASRSE